jgi:hypothetical protein
MISNADLRKRVGCSQNAKLRRWLDDRRIPWTTDANGNPVTTEGLLEEGIRGDQKAAESLPACAASTTEDFGA